MADNGVLRYENLLYDVLLQTAMLEEWMKDSVSLRQKVNDLRAKYPAASQRTMGAILNYSGYVRVDWS